MTRSGAFSCLLVWNTILVRRALFSNVPSSEWRVLTRAHYWKVFCADQEQYLTLIELLHCFHLAYSYQPQWASKLFNIIQEKLTHRLNAGNYYLPKRYMLGWRCVLFLCNFFLACCAARDRMGCRQVWFASSLQIFEFSAARIILFSSSVP